MQDGPQISRETAEIVYECYRELFGPSQSLERLAERGGFGWAEVAFLFRELARTNPGAFRRIMGRDPRYAERYAARHFRDALHGEVLELPKATIASRVARPVEQE